MAKVALLFGSFNPVHLGHLALAQYAIEHGGVQAVWFVISPQNPLKDAGDLLPIDVRFDLLELAVLSLKNKHIAVSKVEMELDSPQYTIRTLELLKERYPEHRFRPLIGTDILGELNNWKAAEIITRDFGWYVYPRPCYVVPEVHLASANMEYWADAPTFEYSSTQLRKDWMEGKSLQDFMPKEVYQRWKENVSTELRALRTGADWYEEGVRQRKWNRFGEAANCFDKALQLDPNDQKARVAVEMLQSIQAFYHSDIYNP